MATILECRDLAKSFGTLTVADALAFAVSEGEALGVIGPNGAGKTTLFDLLSGVAQPNRGQILFDGHDITALAAARRARLGIGRTFQIPRPFEGLSMFENLLVAATFARRPDAAGNADEHALRALALTGLDSKANLPVGQLALLDRKRLELARALAGQPRLLLLDEIAGGLTEAECHTLIAQIRTVRATGITVIWIEHVVHALLAVVDRLLVLDAGRLAADGEPHAVLATDRVKAIYLGVAVDGH
ncbi:MAG: ATP-binding cassette domain-containing protein [Rhodocyclaceae bacterium]|nr:ATP-binding cassette domain-containing protein [Rhodocyclaceae bacterium]